MKLVASKLVELYIRLICRTVKFEFTDSRKLRDDMVIGFWHGDSQAAILLMNYLYKNGRHVHAVVTTRWRGDSLSSAIRRLGHNPLRTPDGLGLRQNISQLKDAMNDKNRIFAMAMDGPFGPGFEPKKFLFRLAADAGREVVVLKYQYSRAIRSKRWDKYAVPLPFSSVSLTMGFPGTPGRNEVREFTQLRERILKESGILQEITQ